MSKATEFLTSIGLTSDADAKANQSELIADFMAVYTAYKDGTLDTNAKIGIEIKKAFTRQEKRDERAAARAVAKAQRIAERKAARQAARQTEKKS